MEEIYQNTQAAKMIYVSRSLKKSISYHYVVIITMKQSLIARNNEAVYLGEIAEMIFASKSLDYKRESMLSIASL